MISRIESHFPRLVETGYIQTSPEDSKYNCIAFTLGDLHRWWWPPVYGRSLDSYWPTDAPCQETVEAFVEMYRLIGFKICTSREPEIGHVKVAIYAESKEGLPAHAALQLPNGKWISKMWDQEDIVHALEGIEGPPHYFAVAAILRCELNRAPAQLQTLILRYAPADE